MSNTNYEETLAHVNTNSKPSELRITDVKVCDMGRPFNTTLIKIMTNQGIEGYGQVRENGSRMYAVMLKRLILGENPCNVDKLFRRIKQFGWHSHQGGGVSGIELALWDIAGKAYGIPIWQMLGGKFRDKIRVYCDTDVNGKPDGKKMGKVLKDRIDKSGYTFMKMDLSADELLIDVPGAMCAPIGFTQEYHDAHENFYNVLRNGPGADMSAGEKLDFYVKRNDMSDAMAVPGPFTGLHLTEKGLDIMEEYVKEVRNIIGYEIPLAVDHFGHIGTGDCIKLAQRLDKYNLAWYEDMVPWHMADQLAEISRNSRTPLCTGEDIYLKENFIPLLEKKGVSIIHPDIISTGGIYETKKIGDMAQDYGVPMAIHMNETPIAAMAAIQVAATTENFMVMEFHHHDYPWWSDLVKTKNNPIVQNGHIAVPDEPGLGIEKINDEVLAEHLHPRVKGMWTDTDEWDDWYAMDRLWL
ncbi:MAG: mandelate racemase/muconate lactonizing enzyme family protein [Oscillospiraceae bacterium]|jgi:L-alanine-DL-glutamate epimerase-like enolase superfamily enzyme|nr:mandelate racemase/muconate lactonizing enzyme family protein [Oscillospiraceae bacterium]